LSAPRLHIFRRNGSNPEPGSTEVVVKGMLLAGAIAAAAMVVPAWAQTPGTAVPSPAQAPPPEATPMSAPEQAGGGQQGAGGAWMRERGAWGMPGGAIMHHDLWRGAMMRWNPQQRCIDRLAWRAARRAYVETELNLSAEQRPLWDRLQTIAQNEQQKERQLCNQLKPDEQLTMLDRLDRAQQFLSARLAALQAAKPAIEALYQALSPD
jgi:hypothetical protein